MFGLFERCSNGAVITRGPNVPLNLSGPRVSPIVLVRSEELIGLDFVFSQNRFDHTSLAVLPQVANTEFYMAVRFFQRGCFSVISMSLEIGNTNISEWYYR